MEQGAGMQEHGQGWKIGDWPEALQHCIKKSCPSEKTLEPAPRMTTLMSSAAISFQFPHKTHLPDSHWLSQMSPQDLETGLPAFSSKDSRRDLVRC